MCTIPRERNHPVSHSLIVHPESGRLHESPDLLRCTERTPRRVFSDQHCRHSRDTHSGASAYSRRKHSPHSFCPSGTDGPANAFRNASRQPFHCPGDCISDPDAPEMDVWKNPSASRGPILLIPEKNQERLWIWISAEQQGNYRRVWRVCKDYRRFPGRSIPGKRP